MLNLQKKLHKKDMKIENKFDQLIEEKNHNILKQPNRRVNEWKGYRISRSDFVYFSLYFKAKAISPKN